MGDATAVEGLARVLFVIAHPPRPRREPLPGDLTGAFEQWFDGGAWRDEGRNRVWAFLDGATAWQDLRSPALVVRVVLPDGTALEVREQPRTVATSGAGCAGCGKAIQEGQTHVVMGGRAYHVGCVPTH
jgi:hypothetical protein